MIHKNCIANLFGWDTKKFFPRSNTSTAGGDSDGSSSSSEEAKNPFSYTAPQWLLQEKQTPKFFSIPLMPVPTATRKAIQTFVQIDEGKPPFPQKFQRLFWSLQSTAPAYNGRH